MEQNFFKHIFFIKYFFEIFLDNFLLSTKSFFLTQFFVPSNFFSEQKFCWNKIFSTTFHLFNQKKFPTKFFPTKLFSLPNFFNQIFSFPNFFLPNFVLPHSDQRKERKKRKASWPPTLTNMDCILATTGLISLKIST